ncbi:MAG: periplasmic divalent cation tolerance protein [Verrucomicrobiales bacterium]|jgi:periplasmic divalent cation tolerance protein
MDCLIVISNFPDSETAERIARTLVDERLAACVNLLPGVTSIYRWHGATESTSEVAAWIKTTVAAYPTLEARLNTLHPYDVPEILKLSPLSGLSDYLDWVASSVTADRPDGDASTAS